MGISLQLGHFSCKCVWIRAISLHARSSGLKTVVMIKCAHTQAHLAIDSDFQYDVYIYTCTCCSKKLAAGLAFHCCPPHAPLQQSRGHCTHSHPMTSKVFSCRLCEPNHCVFGGSVGSHVARAQHACYAGCVHNDSTPRADHGH